MPVCLDEAGLATVLSHEIGHVVASHSAETASSLLLFGIASMPAWPLVAILSIGVIIEEFELICFLCLGPIAVAAAWCFRTRESEADYIGLVLLARAGFDLRKAVEF
jgi:Zn-dependent protease with chaperone function